MNSSSVLIVILYVVIFKCNTVSTKTWLEASEDKCKFTVNHEDDIHFSENPLLFIKNSRAKDIHECRAVCCNHESCNGYVWDAHDNTENCKLLKCSNEGTDCKQALRKVASDVDKRMHEVGFITGVNNADPSPAVSPVVAKTTIPPALPSLPLSSMGEYPMVTAQKLKEMLEQAASQVLPQKVKDANTTASNEIVSNDLAENNDNSSNTLKPKDPNLNSRISSTKSATTAAAATAKTNTAITKSTAKTSATSNTMVNPTRRPIQRLIGVIETDNRSNHTDNISMTVVFMFGIIFLCVTFFLVGKRWVEGLRELHRRGYTRISYLLNGV